MGNALSSSYRSSFAKTPEPPRPEVGSERRLSAETSWSQETFKNTRDHFEAAPQINTQLTTPERMPHVPAPTTGNLDWNNVYQVRGNGRVRLEMNCDYWCVRQPDGTYLDSNGDRYDNFADCR